MGDRIVETLKKYDGMINELGAYPAKHIINSLTMIAEDLTIAKHLAPFLVKKLNLVGPAYKLPILYLMDSIIKNVGGPYAHFFSQTLAPVFVAAVQVVNPTDLNRFNHVLKTWEAARLIPPPVLAQMRTATDGALRTAQPADQPTSFSKVTGAVLPTPRPASRSEDSQLELQMRQLLRQLQTDDGIHPTEHLSLEEVRARNPEMYANLKLTCHQPAPAPIPEPVLGHRPIQPPLRPAEPLLPHPSRSEPRFDRTGGRGGGGGLLGPPPPQSVTQPPPSRRPVVSRSPPRSRIHRDVSGPPSTTSTASSRPSAPSQRDVMKLLKKINTIASNPVRPLTCSEIQVNKKRIDANVYSLYGALPEVCASSGLRFNDKAKLSEHMDFLFHYNRALRERTKGGISRSWYPNEEQWSTDFRTVSNSKEETSAGFVQKEDDIDMGNDALNSARVAVDASITKCRICGESFTKCWDEEEEEWMYQNAVVGTIQVDAAVYKQTIFHKYCYDSAVASSKLSAILPSQLAPGSPMVPLKREIDYDSEQVQFNKRLKPSDDMTAHEL
ncbi:unnamed protein product [Aphanomyces euteiches]|nr:hypothetical protein Ae201684P_013974 [Aphanomyces euteiches]